jgi:hypothetical protein
LDLLRWIQPNKNPCSFCRLPANQRYLKRKKRTCHRDRHRHYSDLIQTQLCHFYHYESLFPWPHQPSRQYKKSFQASHDEHARHRVDRGDRALQCGIYRC